MAFGAANRVVFSLAMKVQSRCVNVIIRRALIILHDNKVGVAEWTTFLGGAMTMPDLSHGKPLGQLCSYFETAQSLV